MRARLTRRHLLATAGAGAATAALGTAQAAGAAEPEGQVTDVDVAIVGAGLTGLSAARQLRAAGHSVHVIEADERVGGRIWTGLADDGVTTLNWGATFLGPSQARITALGRELGVPTYRTYNAGNNILQLAGGVRRYKGTVPTLDLVGLLELQKLMSNLNRWAGSVDTGSPWKHPRAVEWDSQTVWSWINANTSHRGVKALLELAVLSVFSMEAREVSLLQMLFYIHSATDLNDLLGVAGGAQESQFAGGSQLIPERLAAMLGPGAVTLSSPVRRISQDGGGVTVEAERVAVTAKRALVAVPPTMIPRIAYAPAISAHKDQLTQRMAMGSVGKAIGIYPTAFWRAKGFSGQVTSDTGPVRITFDLSDPAGRPGVLMGFIDGQDARDWGPLAAAERRRLVLAQFTRWFGPEAGNPAEFHDLWWDAHPIHRGCPVSVPAPGALVGFGDALRRVEGKLHFASTETATRWNGYMDGALQAGEGAAGAIDAALASVPGAAAPVASAGA